jgi:hypothetical protein
MRRTRWTQHAIGAASATLILTIGYIVVNNFTEHSTPPDASPARAAGIAQGPPDANSKRSNSEVDRILREQQVKDDDLKVKVDWIRTRDPQNSRSAFQIWQLFLVRSLELEDLRANVLPSNAALSDFDKKRLAADFLVQEQSLAETVKVYREIGKTEADREVDAVKSRVDRELMESITSR